ncbi:MAG: CPBP family glutamic-type intramembrane protease [Verrucomicrobiota bacterium]
MTIWPTARGWMQCLAVYFVFGALALLLGFAFGSLRFELCGDAPGRLFRFTVIAFLVPCLSEELLFRAILLPDPTQPASLGYRVARAIAALTLFVLWHPLNGMFLKTAARQVFMDPGFLILAALLGSCCTVVYMRTSSIWPSTLIHWVSLICWKIFLGGRIF